MISVIIPTYKPGDFIGRCIESLERQTLGADGFEVLLVLNGCGEPYLGQLKSRIEESPLRIRLIHTPEPGVSNARNLGVDAAKGEYIVFQDDDDTVSPDYLETMLREAGEGTVVCSNVAAVNPEGDHEDRDYFLAAAYRKVTGADGSRREAGLVEARGFLSTLWGKLLPRDVIGDRRSDTRFTLGEDSLYMFAISDRIKRLRLTGEDTKYFVTIRPGSVSRRKYTYTHRVKTALRLVGSYTSLILRHPMSYNLTLYATRVGATLLKLRKKHYE